MFLTRYPKNGSTSFSGHASTCLRPSKKRYTRFLLAFALTASLALAVQADTGGSISGTVTDQSGSVVPDTTVSVLNLDTTVQQSTKTNANGFYNFTALPVGRYEIEIVREGFKPYKRTGLGIDINSELRVDVSLSMGEQSEEVVVTGAGVNVETVDTNLGDVVTGTQIVIDSVEWAQLYGFIVDSAGRKPRHVSDSYFSNHVWRQG